MKKGTLARALAAASLAAPCALAQIATDGSLGSRVSFSGVNVLIPSTVGTRQGANLFHSFITFNVDRGQVVNFGGAPIGLNLPAISTIVARVTGPTASTILGTIRSTTPGASLYLINPNGVVFGQGAVVDVAGSFYASSAHYLRFADGARFESRLGSDVSLSFSSPAGFGFEGAAAPIAVQGATLRAAEGATVGLVGGGLLLGGTTGATRLEAPGGRAILVAVAGPGFVNTGADGPALSGFSSMADVVLRPGATVTVSEGTGRSTGGGGIFVRGQNISLDQALLLASTRNGNGRGIDIEATRDVTLLRSQVIAVTTGAGNAGSLRLAGRNVVVLDASLVDTSCDPGCTTGAGGLLRVHADEAFIIRSHTPAISGAAFVVSNSFGGGRTGEIEVDAGRLVIEGNAFMQGMAFGTGSATVIRLRTGEILLLDGGQVDVSTRATGNGGAILVQNSGGIRIQGGLTDANGLFFPSGFFSNTDRTGNAGSLTIATRTLEVLSGGEISSSARPGSAGRGGNVRIEASERVVVAGATDAAKSSGIVTNTFAGGDAGEIFLSAPLIEIVDSGKVQSQSQGAGHAGRIHIEGRDLVMTSGGQVSSDARGSGDAGAVEVALTGSLSISGANTGIFAKTYGVAHGGSIAVDAARIELHDAGGIFASTDGSGDAGSIAVHAREAVVMDSRSRIISEAVAAGDAGRIDVRTEGTLSMRDGSRISTSTRGAGNAGEITIAARDAIALSTDAQIASESVGGSGLAGDVAIATAGVLDLRSGGRISTAATSSDGGNITIDAATALLDGGLITTEVGTGRGAGGNMQIRIPTLVLRDGAITANAFGGPGGNIRIASRTFIPSATSRVTASSTLGVDGVITLESPALDPTGELLVPAPVFFDAASVLAGSCGPRLAGRASSLVFEPRRPADIAPDRLRSMMEILDPKTQLTCAPASVAHF